MTDFPELHPFPSTLPQVPTFTGHNDCEYYPPFGLGPVVGDTRVEVVRECMASGLHLRTDFHVSRRSREIGINPGDPAQEGMTFSRIRVPGIGDANDAEFWRALAAYAAQTADAIEPNKEA